MSESSAISGISGKSTFKDCNIRLLCDLYITPGLASSTHPSDCDFCSKDGTSYLLDTGEHERRIGHHSIQAIDGGRSSSIILKDKGSRPEVITCDPLYGWGRSSTLVGDHAINMQWGRLPPEYTEETKFS